MNRFWNFVEEGVREVLLAATRPISDPDLAGAVFGIGLVVSDHLLMPLKAVLK